MTYRKVVLPFATEVTGRRRTAAPRAPRLVSMSHAVRSVRLPKRRSLGTSHLACMHARPPDPSPGRMPLASSPCTAEHSRTCAQTRLPPSGLQPARLSGSSKLPIRCRSARIPNMQDTLCRLIPINLTVLSNMQHAVRMHTTRVGAK